MGNTIRERSDLREPIVIITKGHGYTPAAFEQELSTSLDKLGIKGQGDLKIGDNEIRLVYLLHGINDERWKQICESGVLELAKQAKAEGRINYIGFSSHYKQRNEIKEALDTGIFDVVELPYNIFNRSLVESGTCDLFKYTYDRDVGIINMKAFGGNGMQPILELLSDVVDVDHGTMLNFCLANPHIATVDAGAKYVDEIMLDIKTALKTRMSPEKIEELKQEADTVSSCTEDICRECMHCMEKFTCPEEIDFPGILALYSRYLVCEELGRDTSQYRKEYMKFSRNSEDCVECEECLPWCEYELQIPEMLKRADQALG